jgi:hypothetical protein
MSMVLNRLRMFAVLESGREGTGRWESNSRWESRGAGFQVALSDGKERRSQSLTPETGRCLIGVNGKERQVEGRGMGGREGRVVRETC